jgi:hypothetical protein
MIVVARVNFMVAETEACRGGCCILGCGNTVLHLAERTRVHFPLENSATGR